MNSQLSVIIPCYNEADALPSAMPEITRYCRKNNWKLIIVDDGSSDDTYTCLQKFIAEDVTILHHKRNRGYGAAIKTGIRMAATPYVVTIDADGQHDPADLEILLKTALENDADMIVGKRPINASSTYRTLGKWIIRSITKMLIELPVEDQNSGLKLYSRETALKLLPLTLRR